MQVLLYGYKYLIRIDRLYEIVGNLAAHCLIHDILFLTFSDHYHRDVRKTLLYHRQSLETGESRHILIENNEVEWLGKGHVESVAAIIGRGHIVALVSQKEQMRFQQVDFIIGP